MYDFHVVSESSNYSSQKNGPWHNIVLIWDICFLFDRLSYCFVLLVSFEQLYLWWQWHFCNLLSQYIIMDNFLCHTYSHSKYSCSMVQLWNSPICCRMKVHDNLLNQCWVTLEVSLFYASRESYIWTSETSIIKLLSGLLIVVLLLWHQMELLWHHYHHGNIRTTFISNNSITQKTCNKKYTWLPFLLLSPSGYSNWDTENF